MLRKLNYNEKRVLENTGYLFVFQLLNMLIPLIILPYIIKILTIKNYGLVTFIQTVIAYFTLFTEYGFNIKTTKEIAQYKKNHKKVIEIFNNVFFTKIYLSMFFFIVFLIIIISFPKIFQEDFLVYIYAYLFVIGISITPTWLFQGFEDMKPIIYINTLSKIFFILSIFLFIHDSQDYPVFILLNSLSYFFLGIILLLFAIKKYNLSFYIVSCKNAFNELKKSYHFFMSKISSTLYLNNNMLILGILGNSESLGYYAVAEKVIRSILTLLGVINQALLPYLSRYYFDGIDIGIKKSFDIAKILGAFLIICIIFLLFLSRYITLLLTGSENEIITLLINLMSPILFFAIMGYFMAYIVLSNLNKMKYVPKAMLLVAVINLLMNVILVPLINEKGAAISLLFAEGLLFVFLIYIYRMEKR